VIKEKSGNSRIELNSPSIESQFRFHRDSHQVGGVRMSVNSSRTTDEAAIRELVEDWARAVRAKNLKGILAK
jgi:hypothetical protein